MSQAVPLAESAHDEVREHAAKIRENPLLEAIYLDVYERILAEVPERAFPRLIEIGSGGGFFRERAGYATTTDCVAAEGIDRVVDACRLEDAFEPGSLDAISAFNVFHHLPDVTAFLRGAARVLRSGGRIVLVEPWFTPLGQWFYRALHHEPSVLDPDCWDLVGEGRLAGANSRLPTSVFRDSDPRFAREFPELRIVKREPFHKWIYLLSGGLRLNTRVPRPLARAIVGWDRRVRKGDEKAGIFALIVVERT
jgi:SAM-dependent methyltransferase